ncbi:MAG: hypothetical protein IJ716_14260 [Lachnospiraceae bacterium]|nr:hypothetical protein [Lachnospiraceae bacterium]
MSQKNFASYGDLEPLFTEIGEKLEGKQSKEFVGTQAEWDALSTAEKKKYVIANITDDDDLSTTYTPDYGLSSFASLTRINDDGEEEDLDRPFEVKRCGQMLSVGGSFRLTRDFSSGTNYIYPVYKIDEGNIHRLVGGSVPLRGYISGGEDIRPWFYWDEESDTIGIGISPNEHLVEDAIIFIGGAAMIDY